MKEQEIITKVKNIMPIIDMIAQKRNLGFDYGYRYAATPPYWECELYEESGKTVEYYKAETTAELIKLIQNKQTS